MTIFVGIVAFFVGNIMMYGFMRGELNDALNRAGRLWKEKEHYRIKYEQRTEQVRKKFKTKN
jgi:ABC-type lipoprotein release transport system permease subunit